jgi:hypothetical protein
VTLSSHYHHIPGSTTDDELNDPFIQPVNCGGPLVCESCTFEYRWYEDRKSKRQLINPSAIDDLDAQTLRKISDKMRSQNPKPNLSIRAREYILYRSIHALADAIASVADDQQGL